MEALALLGLARGAGVEVVQDALRPLAVDGVVEHLAPDPVVVVGRPGVELAVGHARGHAQQVADRGLAVGRGCDLGPVVGGAVVQRADQPLVVRDAHQHRREGLGHRERAHRHARLAVVLVALGHDLPVLDHQQAGGLHHVEVVVDALGEEAPAPLDGWRRGVVRKGHGRGRGPNLAAQGRRGRARPAAHAARRLAQRVGAAGVAACLAERLGVGAVGAQLAHGLLGPRGRQRQRQRQRQAQAGDGPDVGWVEKAGEGAVQAHAGGSIRRVSRPL